MAKNAPFLLGRRPCIFCEGYGHRSYEHVWSKWLHAYLPSAPVRGHIRSGKRFQGDLASVRLRVVCEGCNNGWMSKLEEAAKPILVPLVRGRPTILGKRNQEILARWIALKVMVLEYASAKDVVAPQAERTIIMKGGIPPAHWQIWIGRHASRMWLVRYKGFNTTALAIPKGSVPSAPVVAPPKNVNNVTLGVGYLLISVVFMALPGLEFEAKEGIRHNLFRLWPYSAGTFWPATPLLMTGEADRLAASFGSVLGNLPEWP